MLQNSFLRPFGYPPDEQKTTGDKERNNSYQHNRRTLFCKGPKKARRVICVALSKKILYPIQRQKRTM